MWTGLYRIIGGPDLKSLSSLSRRTLKVKLKRTIGSRAGSIPGLIRLIGSVRLATISGVSRKK
jgi:hypothetical protein